MSDCTTITENNMRYGNPISTEKTQTFNPFNFVFENRFVVILLFTLKIRRKMFPVFLIDVANVFQIKMGLMYISKNIYRIYVYL